MAIIREEGLALLHELKGEIGDAITHRKREIHLTERLHKEAQSPRYDDGTRAYMLRGRNTMDIRQRREILAALKNDEAKRRRAPLPPNHLWVEEN